MNSSSMELGPIGIWTAQFDYQPGGKVREAAGKLDRLVSGRSGTPKVSAANRLRMQPYF